MCWDKWKIKVSVLINLNKSFNYRSVLDLKINLFYVPSRIGIIELLTVVHSLAELYIVEVNVVISKPNYEQW